MCRVRFVAVVLLALMTVGGGLAQEDMPAPAQFVWETPGEVLLPLEELLVQGRAAMVRAGAEPGSSSLAMIGLPTSDVLWSTDLASRLRWAPRSRMGSGDSLWSHNPPPGAWTLAIPGNFFFVHWMKVLNDTLYLHSGKPGEASLGAIPLTPQQG